MKDLKLPDSEYNLLKIIWELQPIASGELVTQCQKQLGWKKSTTYTVLKRLCEKDVLKNENATVSAIISRQEVQQYESKQVVQRGFNGSLPQFIAAFMNGEKLTKQEAENLKRLIDNYKEK